MSDEAGGTERLELAVPEMDCPSCAGKVENSLDRTDGIVEYETRPTAGKVIVRYDPDRLTPAKLAAAVRRAGYSIAGSSVPLPGVTDTTANVDDDAGAGKDKSAVGDPDSVWHSERAIKTWISGIFAIAGLLVEFLLTGVNAEVAVLLGRELLVADVLFLVATAAAGETILTNGYYSARNRSLDIDLLISIAIIGALLASFGFGAGLYLEAALLSFLFSVAELLEQYSIDRARSSLRELLNLSPDEATIRRDGEERTIPVEDVRIGDVAIVRPGEKIPMDGTVQAGESAVNQAPITGESVPVDKMPGDEVFAGTINESGYLEVEVTAEAADNTLSRIIQLVEDARANRTEREQFVDRFAGYYTPIVVALAVLTAIVPPFFIADGLTVELLAGYSYTFPGAWEVWFLYGLTLLVLACPCAFVISTPVSVVSGITSAAKNGVLIKGGNHLETMGEIDTIALDKTGTLTKGELVVTDVVPLNGNSEADVLRCARGIESRSEHPIGEAIVEHAADRGIDRPSVGDFESLTGKGVEATVGERRHYAGKPGLFEELGFDLSHVHAATDGGIVTAKSRSTCERNDCLDLLEDTIPRLQSEGKTVVLVGTENELEGVIAVADELRPEAKATVDRLRELGIGRIVMLTGDNERTAGAIAAEVGVDEYRAGLLPAGKVAAIEELGQSGRGVAMVGDGVNDAPSLATADVGIAMGAAGTDTAIETADIALMGDDLSRLPYLYELSHRANGVIRQNIWSSLAAKALLAAGVPFGLVPVWAAVLIGDAGMTVAVTGNALRLSRISPADS
ncbi:cation-translocating P-type ATPase [Halalkaliarchaeum sp. AArc-GB]|uniref:heavy metal translocating P-type ATPase n=1 Tax=Halalkaliarchaeum sp. AArc-GB TaxID=3074078 RepID=UPI00285980C3|nr:cation-translocating P-type ATPase [Halalkaliarchaeum sp. AArc-GB]MDR5671624.1 cation-translocating P-type ATPase [Halalkaliarchaeum sp. AArc-GB]